MLRFWLALSVLLPGLLLPAGLALCLCGESCGGSIESQGPAETRSCCQKEEAPAPEQPSHVRALCCDCCEVVEPRPQPEQRTPPELPVLDLDLPAQRASIDPYTAITPHASILPDLREGVPPPPPLSRGPPSVPHAA